MDRKLANNLLARAMWSMYDSVKSSVPFCLQKTDVHNSTLLKNTYVTRFRWFRGPGSIYVGILCLFNLYILGSIYVYFVYGFLSPWFRLCILCLWFSNFLVLSMYTLSMVFYLLGSVYVYFVYGFHRLFLSSHSGKSGHIEK